MKTDFYSRIGSVTKTFTVTGVLQLADQGKFGLDDPIAKFVDGVNARRSRCQLASERRDWLLKQPALHRGELAPA